MGKPGKMRIGTSGWCYDHWAGVFYPDELPSSRRLAYYARHFSSTEINSSFYRLPSAQTLRRWRDTVDSGFRFAVKASRYITHMKKLKDPHQGLHRFLERITTLGDRLGPILFQLPPRWHFNAERLETFLDALPGEFRYVLEFRDPGWINDHSLALLRAHDVAFCIYEIEGYLTPQHITADFVYVRLHGPDDAYAGCYDQRTLARWADTADGWRRQGRDVFVYFDNDEAGYAVRNALTLATMLGA